MEVGSLSLEAKWRLIEARLGEKRGKQKWLLEVLGVPSEMWPRQCFGSDTRSPPQAASFRLQLVGGWRGWGCFFEPQREACFVGQTIWKLHNSQCHQNIVARLGWLVKLVPTWILWGTLGAFLDGLIWFRSGTLLQMIHSCSTISNVFCFSKKSLT